MSITYQNTAAPEKPGKTNEEINGKSAHAANGGGSGNGDFWTTSKEYVKNIFSSIGTLLQGMKVTGYYFTHPSEIITKQYPENRDDMGIPERFKGEVIMPHDENNEHRCTGCTACELACPNGSIKILTYQEEVWDEKRQKYARKKRLDQFIYRVEMCCFCNLCIDACPTDAIKMGNDFEHSDYVREPLTRILNNPNSDLVEELK